MSTIGFKKTAVWNEQVPHRMKGAHAKRDPLLDEKVGSAKRRKATDGSDGVYYKETKVERDARVAATKASADTASKKAAKAREDVTGKLGGFKDRLKASRLPEEAEQAEKKHKEELEAEEKAALAKLAEKESAAAPSAVSSSSGATAPRPPDQDERVSFSEIWAEGDEESSADWLSGKGLKFHTTADKAFSMDQKKFKEAVEVFDPLENREAQADRAKKRSEMRMEEFRRAQKPAGMRKP